MLLRTLYAGAATLAAAAAYAVPNGRHKVLRALHARRGIRGRYAGWAARSRDAARPLLWMHAPSVGEGLMSRPVLALLRSRRPELQIAYTYFSPSAEVFAAKLDVDFRDYLPFDSPGAAAAALDALRPDALVFSKLDVWPELTRRAARRGVRLGLISATLSEGSSRVGPLARALLREAYASLDAVGAVDEADAGRLAALGARPENIEVTGDTRYDQVVQRAGAVDRRSALLAPFDDDRPILVAGSTWPADEGPLLDAFALACARRPGIRLLIAPHEPTAAHLEAIERGTRARTLATRRLGDASPADADVVLVDRVGVLADLYAIADVAFVGGGFHAAGLHSVVEPAAFSVPVLFGPMHGDSRDAALLLAAGGARGVRTADDISAALAEWLGTAAGREAGARARQVVERGLGAAERSAALVARLLDR